MKIFAPDYYNDFRCIANQCKHSCCIGWEIDIYDETNEYYNSINTDFGKKIRENIVQQDGYNCFKLTENERCPFLNENNLCDIILNLSEDALCQICTDHPRFRNFYSDRIEIGLGLCCEAAASLVLRQKDNVKIIEIQDDKQEEILDETEKEFFIKRKQLFDEFQNRDLPIEERIFYNQVNSPFETLLEKYLSLEILDNNWQKLITELKSCYNQTKDIRLPINFDICFEQLLAYFAYRHFPLILDGINEEKVIMFIKTSVSTIYALCQLHISKCGKITIDDIVEYSRMYSSEIEYSQENLDALMA